MRVNNKGVAEVRCKVLGKEGEYIDAVSWH
jgi:hypothetical protein